VQSLGLARDVGDLSLAVDRASEDVGEAQLPELMQALHLLGVGPYEDVTDMQGVLCLDY
jgi:hypothetical protein